MPPANALGLQQQITRWIVLQKAPSHPINRAPSPCTHTISGSISLPFRGSFNLSLTVLVLYRSQYIFSLGTWSSQIQSGFLVSRPTRQMHPKIQPALVLVVNIRLAKLGIPGFHRLWRNFPIPSARIADFLPYVESW